MEENVERTTWQAQVGAREGVTYSRSFLVSVPDVADFVLSLEITSVEISLY